ncbi:hypothetical protein B0H14DRAFT_3459427 [Mycena olivaceomarginata]|nr:hypothetical protein B0H14DRAFT_3459427 [Mycena olivaceomarginata]
MPTIGTHLYKTPRLTIHQETPSAAPTAARASSVPADPQPKPKPAPKVSETTLKGSRSIFRDAADKRYGAVAAEAFHPTSRCVEGDLNPSNSKSKKRNRHPPKPEPKTEVEPVARSRLIEAVVPKTSLSLALGLFEKYPGPHIAACGALVCLQPPPEPFISPTGFPQQSLEKAARKDLARHAAFAQPL